MLYEISIAWIIPIQEDIDYEVRTKKAEKMSERLHTNLEQQQIEMAGEF